MGRASEAWAWLDGRSIRVDGFAVMRIEGRSSPVWGVWKPNQAFPLRTEPAGKSTHGRVRWWRLRRRAIAFVDETFPLPGADPKSEQLDPSAAVLEEVRDERLKQLERWTRDHDDIHVDGEIGTAAAVVVAPRPLALGPDWAHELRESTSDRRRRLIIGAALLVAEVERIDRAETARQRCEEADRG